MQNNEKINQNMMDALSEHLSPRYSVLEVACGDGELAEFILKFGVKSYSGFDKAETAVANARKKISAFEEAKMWRSDALTPQPYSKKYNCIVAHQFLHCLAKQDRIKWLSYCKSALWAEGVFIFSSKLETPGTEEEIKTEILAAGFELEEVLHPEDLSAIFVVGPKIS